MAWQCEEYIQHGTVKIKHVLHTPNIYEYIYTYVRTVNLFEGKMSKTSRGEGGQSLQLGPFLRTMVRLRTFFEEIGPDLVCIV